MTITTKSAKSKGSRFEREVRDYFLAMGWSEARLAERRGKDDQGDIDGLPLVIQCKNVTSEELSKAMDEAKVQSQRAGHPMYAVIRRRLRRTIDQAYVTMPLSQFETLLSTAFVRLEKW